MDKISIKNLEVFGNHGVYPEETKLGQKFLVSAELYLDTRAAGNSDNLTQSVNYGEVSHTITNFLTEHTYQLIEAAAEQTARKLLLEYPILDKVALSLHKPWAPIGLPLEDVAVEIERSWHTVYLSVGSNVGDREGYIRQAVQKLNELEDCVVMKVSTLIETEPYGMVDQDRFLNGCLKLRTLFTPQELLVKINEIEAYAKRERTVHWGPRTLDIDIIFYDEQIVAEENLMIPHCDMQHRMFVLEPLCEIAPLAYHPVLHKRVKDIKQAQCDVKSLKEVK